MATQRGEAALITGVYGSGKSSVAAEVAYLLEQRSEPFALLDLDYLSWGGTGSGGRAEEFGLMLANLTAVASNYRRVGIARFVLAYFVRDHAEARLVEEALGVPLTVVGLTVPLDEIERRLLPNVTSGRRDDLRAAAAAIAAAQGAGVADLTIANDRPIGVVARELMAVLGWGDPAGQSGSQRSAGMA